MILIAKSTKSIVKYYDLTTGDSHVCSNNATIPTYTRLYRL